MALDGFEWRNVCSIILEQEKITPIFLDIRVVAEVHCRISRIFQRVMPDEIKDFGVLDTGNAFRSRSVKSRAAPSRCAP